jgi:hypothetical protein
MEYLGLFLSLLLIPHSTPCLVICIFVVRMQGSVSLKVPGPELGFPIASVRALVSLHVSLGT